MANRINNRMVYSHNQMAALYGIHSKTLTAWLDKLKFEREKFKRTYSPKEADEIFSLLGKPFE